MRTFILLFGFILTSCLGHKEVRYSEMASPPRLILNGDEILIKTENSKEYTSFFIYEILPVFDEGSRTILLKGHEAMGREPKSEFKIDIKNMKQDSISAYKIFWVDPDNNRTELKLERGNDQPIL